MEQCNPNCCNQPDPTPKNIADAIKELAGVVIKLKDAGIISQETIDHANRVAITGLDKIQEIIQNVDAQKVASNKNEPNPMPMPNPMPPVWVDPMPKEEPKM